MIEITDKPCKTVEVRKGVIIFYIGFGCEKTEWEIEVRTTKNGTVTHEVFIDPGQIMDELPNIDNEKVHELCNIITGTVEFNLGKQTVKYV